MELGGNLQNLVERARVLHDRLNEEIEKINSSFCRFCSEHGRYCNIVETPFQEKEGLISIKDSLKKVGNALMLLQRLRSWQPIDRQESLTRLEESRLTLMEKIAQYQGRPLGVVEELNACFSNGETAFHRKLRETKKIKGDSDIRNEKRRENPGFCWIRMLFNPWKWKRAAGVTAKLILISASISSTARFCQGGLFSCSSRRKVLSLLKPIDPRTKENSTALSLSNSPLDVFYGRG
ncbi:uncharacterized protein LOC133691562 isoform X2 [Populus nigra]|uniref:uncharacterized protein LOC133691562 isoform X2 n=1 Tax=Populus nigra TaxID=3691 RepID=UPI002B26C450|nr:uncharacterized protein LOC133691562 isoform X2 [Populus nigra]